MTTQTYTAWTDLEAEVICTALLALKERGKISNVDMTFKANRTIEYVVTFVD